MEFAERSLFDEAAVADLFFPKKTNRLIGQSTNPEARKTLVIARYCMQHRVEQKLELDVTRTSVEGFNPRGANFRIAAEKYPEHFPNIKVGHLRSGIPNLLLPELLSYLVFCRLHPTAYSIKIQPIITIAQRIDNQVPIPSHPAP